MITKEQGKDFIERIEEMLTKEKEHNAWLVSKSKKLYKVMNIDKMISTFR